MTTPNTNTGMVLANTQQALTGFAATLAIITAGGKLANGVYKGLSKVQKGTIRTERLKSASAVQSRVLSGELITEGWKLEKHELSDQKGGVKRYSLVAFKRPAPVAAAVATADETLAAAASLLGITVEALKTMQGAKK